MYGILPQYEQMWWERLGKYYIWTILMRHFICLDFSASDWDEVVKNLKKLSPDEFYSAIEQKIPHLSGLNKRHFTSNII